MGQKEKKKPFCTAPEFFCTVERNLFFVKYSVFSLPEGAFSQASPPLSFNASIAVEEKSKL